jgi:uncharacterized protein YdhG (YjbR/CyaY superfamily)
MSTKSKHDPAAVEAYLTGVPGDQRAALESLRRLIQELVPGVEERFSYGAAVMFSLGRDLVGFSAQKNHLSFFTASPKLVEELKSEITRTHKVSGATIHFSVENPLPVELVKKIVQRRLAENAALQK